MDSPLTGLSAALAAAEAAWGPRQDAMELPEPDLIAVNDALGLLRRRLDAVHAAVASQIARASSVDLGADALAKKQGHRSPTALIAATSGTSTADAARLLRIGDATAPRAVFGDTMPARRPAVAEALKTGEIGAQAADAIIALLDKVGRRATRAAVDAAERTLVDQAAGLSLDQLRKILLRAEAQLDPQGVASREAELRDARSLRVYQRDGLVHLNGVFDSETASPIVTAIEALVSADFRSGDDPRPANRAADGFVSGIPDESQPRPDGEAAPRTLPQRQADALALLARHYLACAHTEQPVAGATVIVRITLQELLTETGAATIDGIDQPVTASTARRMAAGGGVIPAVFEAHSELLDWGREKRFATRAQRLALVERDGGCAMCGAPPGITRAHHIRWWTRDAGPTDLANLVLLCEACHHRIHDNGWDVLIDGRGVAAAVWFLPPAHADPARTPRLGGRQRFDYAA